MIVIEKEFGLIESKLEEITNTDPQNLENMEPLDEWRQGDCRIIRLPDDFDKENLEKAKSETQLAPGDTVGSRHCLSSRDGVQFFSLKYANALDGPIIKTSKPVTITHPEHGDCCNLPPGWYAFPGQRTFAEELRRVSD